jgi:hypothetical protein
MNAVIKRVAGMPRIIGPRAGAQVPIRTCPVVSPHSDEVAPNGVSLREEPDQASRELGRYLSSPNVLLRRDGRRNLGANTCYAICYVLYINQVLRPSSLKIKHVGRISSDRAPDRAFAAVPGSRRLPHGSVMARVSAGVVLTRDRGKANGA